MMSLIVFLITGLVAGIIADTLLGRKHGWLVAMIIGVIGAWIGGFLANMLHIPSLGTGIGHWLFNVAVATVGAVILIYVLGLFRGGRPAAQA
jgi:uncharacterized membrane protein YeaQ/YmgE (transglycosylase-associated protein family)